MTTKVGELKMMSVADVAAMPRHCACRGCKASYRGNMPKGWVYLITYWSPSPKPYVLDVPQRDMPRDTQLCPEHHQQLESQLVDLNRELDGPPMGSA